MMAESNSPIHIDFEISDSDLAKAKQSGATELQIELFGNTYTIDLTKHLGDQHDQSSHGRGGGARVNLAPDTGAQIGGGGGGGSSETSEKPSPRSSVKYMEMNEKDLPVIEGTSTRVLKSGKRQIRLIDVVDFLNEENASQGKLTEHTPENREKLSKAMVDEIEYAVAQDKNAVGWYDRQVEESIRILGKIHPELQTDLDQMSLFKTLLAVNSNQQETGPNFERANELYTKFKETGKLEVDGTFGGDSAGNINLHLKLTQEIIDSGKLSGLRKFMETEYSVKELKDLGFGMGGENNTDLDGNTYMVKGAMVFGPKLGSFYGNLSGDFSTVTMDRWFMRTHGRLSGNATDITAEADTAVKRVRRMKEAIKDMPDDAFYGFKKETLVLHMDKAIKNKGEIEENDVLVKWAKENTKHYAAKDADGKAYTDKSETNLSAKVFYESMHGIQDAPRNGTERNWIRSVVSDAQMRLKSRGTDISIADMQAVLWYHEKTLYKKFGYKARGSSPADYADAARQLEALVMKSKTISKGVPTNMDVPDEESSTFDQDVANLEWSRIPENGITKLVVQLMSLRKN